MKKKIFLFVFLILFSNFVSATICEEGMNDATCIMTQEKGDVISVTIVTTTKHEVGGRSIKHLGGFYSLDNSDEFVEFSNVRMSNEEQGDSSQPCYNGVPDYLDPSIPRSNDIGYRFCTSVAKDVFSFDIFCKSEEGRVGAWFDSDSIVEQYELNGKFLPSGATSLAEFFENICKPKNPLEINGKLEVVFPEDDPNCENPLFLGKEHTLFNPNLDLEYKFKITLEEKIPENTKLVVKYYNVDALLGQNKISREFVVQEDLCTLGCFENPSVPCECVIPETNLYVYEGKRGLFAGLYIREINSINPLENNNGFLIDEALSEYCVGDGCVKIQGGENPEFRFTIVGSSDLEDFLGLETATQSIIDYNFGRVFPFSQRMDKFEFYYNQDIIPYGELKREYGIVSDEEYVIINSDSIIRSRSCGADHIIFLELEEEHFNCYTNLVGISYFGNAGVPRVMHEEGHDFCGLDDEYVYIYEEKTPFGDKNCADNCDYFHSLGLPCIGTSDPHDENGCTSDVYFRSSDKSIMNGGEKQTTTFNILGCARCLVEIDKISLNNALEICKEEYIPCETPEDCLKLGNYDSECTKCESDRCIFSTTDICEFYGKSCSSGKLISNLDCFCFVDTQCRLKDIELNENFCDLKTNNCELVEES